MSRISLTHRRLELLSALLLAAATIATAWAAYQSRQWTGEQAQNTSKATADRIAVNRYAALANRQVQIDVAIFIQWLDARAGSRPRLAVFYRQRFRPEFKPAFAAWLATRPLTSRSAPPSPFAMPQYRLAANAQAERLERAAARSSDRSKDANQRADNYLLAVVLLATALFFAGISTKFETTGIRAAILGAGGVIFVAVVIWMATFPAQLTT